jgi:hypothetical protein
MTNPRSTESQSDALNTPENQGSLARPSASEANYREGYLHGRTSESQQEDARNLRGQANAIHTANAVNTANAGNNLAVGLLLGFLTIGAIIGFYVFTQTSNPSPPPVDREINNTETNTTIERTQEIVPVPVPQQTSAPEAPSQIIDPNPVSPAASGNSNGGTEGSNP